MLSMNNHNPTKRQRHAGKRTCAGCGQRVDRDRVRAELLRLVLVEQDEGLKAHVDLSGSGVGRGSWVHTRPKCLSDACNRGLAKSAKAKVDADEARICQELVDQAARRIEGLLGTAIRAKKAVAGSDAVRDALSHARVSLLIIATDAAAAAKHSEVRRFVQEDHVAQQVAVQEERVQQERAQDDATVPLGTFASYGTVVSHGTKETLGRILGRREVGVIAIIDDGLAAALRHTIALSETFTRG